ncbi:hypothetical protein [Desulfopila sp. IMCC35006]|uniref:hypothetical protein n=1 Tax=Desulfopila sp. IMCC35006 TaxID=2569542 RepID=UPI0012946E70|nr:hypothetical protein [Desulfopila sp. IMCC35006]
MMTGEVIGVAVEEIRLLRGVQQGGRLCLLYRMKGEMGTRIFQFPDLRDRE